MVIGVYTLIKMKRFLKIMAMFTGVAVVATALFCCCLERLAIAMPAKASCHGEAQADNSASHEPAKCDCHREISSLPDRVSNISSIEFFKISLLQLFDVVTTTVSPTASHSTFLSQGPPPANYASLAADLKNPILRV